MRSPTKPYRSGQGGYTLVELIITTALGALLMTVMVSVFLTSTRAAGNATDRIEASSQIRNFEYFAYEDFGGSAVSDFNAGCTASSPCTSQVTLHEIKFDNPALTYPVTYAWDQSKQVLDRTVDTAPPLHAAISVTGYQWYIDANGTVVIALTVTVGAYTDAQTFRFYPKRNP